MSKASARWTRTRRQQLAIASALTVVLVVSPLAGSSLAQNAWDFLPTTTTSITLPTGSPTVDPLGTVNSILDPLVSPTTATTTPSDPTSTTDTTSTTSTTSTTIPTTRRVGVGGIAPVSGTSSGTGGTTPQVVTPGVDTEPPRLPAALLPDARYDPTYLPMSGPRSTDPIVDMLASHGLPSSVLEKVLPPFPVMGRAHYTDDWHAPRITPYPHEHEGTDIMADRGTPIVSASAGRISWIRSDYGAGGNSIWIDGSDGISYYYAHLDTFEPGLVDGSPVLIGQRLGTVGTTGDAVGGPPHLHFEVHPGGREAVPPVPYLDQWLISATTRARSLTDQAATTFAPASHDSPVLPVAVARGVVQTIQQAAQVTNPTDPAQPLLLAALALPLGWAFARRQRRRIAEQG